MFPLDFRIDFHFFFFSDDTPIALAVRYSSKYVYQSLLSPLSYCSISQPSQYWSELFVVSLEMGWDGSGIWNMRAGGVGRLSVGTQYSNSNGISSRSQLTGASFRKSDLALMHAILANYREV